MIDLPANLRYRFQVQRAKMILLAAEGWNNDEIAARLDSRREVVGRWRKRFLPNASIITACATKSCAGCASRICRAAKGVMHFRVKGKRDKIRFVPAHASAQRLIEEYLALAGHGEDPEGPLFRPVRNNRTPEKLDRPPNPASVYREARRGCSTVHA